MTDSRPVLIGMNNPHSSDPRHALAPYPQGVAGHRLWSMLSAVCPEASRSEYMRRFDRRNILHAPVWDGLAATRAAEGLWETLEGRRVVLLGVSVVGALRLPRPPSMIWRVDSGVRWCLVPHPSGLNRWYNDEVNRLLVGLQMEDLYCQAGAAEPG